MPHKHWCCDSFSCSYRKWSEASLEIKNYCTKEHWDFMRILKSFVNFSIMQNSVSCELLLLKNILRLLRLMSVFTHDIRLLQGRWRWTARWRRSRAATVSASVRQSFLQFQIWCIWEVMCEDNRLRGHLLPKLSYKCMYSIMVHTTIQCRAAKIQL